MSFRSLLLHGKILFKFKLIPLTCLLWLVINLVILNFFARDIEDPYNDQNRLEPSLIPYLKRWHPPFETQPDRSLPGELGKPVNIPQDQLISMKALFEVNHFNLMASDLIAFNRHLPDVRYRNRFGKDCLSLKYPELLPATSVIIVFHNEAWSTLLRTVWSIVNTSPKELVEEIILVDDASQQKHLGQDLEDYVRNFSLPVVILRMVTRSGLVRARLLGASHAKAPIITFLDSHCECTVGWLEPLLARIVQDRTTVACPIIDRISEQTFEFIETDDMLWGEFDWKMEFMWQKIPRRESNRLGNDRTAPIHTPVMAGGLFSIDKSYFYELGSYDPELDIWGGENFEMSFKVWQCGGTVEIVRCSRVGHVYRNASPYSFPHGSSTTVLHNLARVAEVWMDEYRQFLYVQFPEARNLSIGDISSRLNLRRNLQCKSFQWYLEIVYPESTIPLKYDYLGPFRNLETNACLDSMGQETGKNVGLLSCHNKGGNQIFAYTSRGEIMSMSNNCLSASRMYDPVKLVKCHKQGEDQTWSYDRADKTLRHINTGGCLQRPLFSGMTEPLLGQCTQNSTGQQWIQEEFNWR